MKISSGILRCVILLFTVLSCLLGAQQKSTQDIELSCRSFVQDFYDWYVPKALHEHSKPAWNLALRYRKNAFSAELFLRLSEDSEAQAKAKGELVGLDFDPFLNSQDPSERFVVQGVTRKGATYWVEVRGMQSGEMNESVIAEVARKKDGRWQFVNFHYGRTKSSTDENLLTILKMPR